MYNKSIFIIVISCIFISKNIYAQNKSETKAQQIKNRKKVFYSVGASAAIIPEYEGSNSYRILPIVNFSANWINGQYIRINGLNTEFNILKNRKWMLGTALRYNILINETVDSPIVKEGSKHQFTTAFFTLYRF